MEKAAIKELFVVREQEIIIAHLNNFEWNFKRFGVVHLCFDNQRIKMKYIASGNHEGIPTLVLKLCDSRFSSVREIRDEITRKNTTYLIERD